MLINFFLSSNFQRFVLLLRPVLPICPLCSTAVTALQVPPLSRWSPLSFCPRETEKRWECLCQNQDESGDLATGHTKISAPTCWWRWCLHNASATLALPRLQDHMHVEHERVGKSADHRCGHGGSMLSRWPIPFPIFPHSPWLGHFSLILFVILSVQLTIRLSS